MLLRVRVLYRNIRPYQGVLKQKHHKGWQTVDLAEIVSAMPIGVISFTNNTNGFWCGRRDLTNYAIVKLRRNSWPLASAQPISLNVPLARFLARKSLTGFKSLYNTETIDSLMLSMVSGAGTDK
jgi:hypothetical protein